MELANWRIEQAKVIERWREAMNLLNYGYSGDTGLLTIYEGDEIVFETEDHGIYAERLATYGVEL